MLADLFSPNYSAVLCGSFLHGRWGLSPFWFREARPRGMSRQGKTGNSLRYFLLHGPKGLKRGHVHRHKWETHRHQIFSKIYYQQLRLLELIVQLTLFLTPQEYVGSVPTQSEHSEWFRGELSTSFGPMWFRPRILLLLGKGDSFHSLWI